MESALRGRSEPGLRLIETFGWDGATAVRWPLHLARLERSAQALGWAFERAAVELAVSGAAPVGPARLRLTLASDGALQLVATGMPAQAATWRIGLAAARLDSGDPWLAVKSTRRAGYDAARAAMAPGLDEVLLQNERGEVGDGSITSVFFDRGQGMRTPPQSSGLLPGVLRAELLAGTCREEVLLATDLPQVRLWVGNSLRGLIPAVWGGLDFDPRAGCIGANRFQPR